jgi:hypothetical protein
MVSLVVMAVIVLGAGWIVWRRQRRGRAATAPVAPGGIPRETLALQAVTHGASCWMPGAQWVKFGVTGSFYRLSPGVTTEAVSLEKAV